MCSSIRFMACFHCCFNNALLGLPYTRVVWLCCCNTVSSNINLFLHKDFSHASSSSNSISSKFSSRTTEPNNSTEHSAIPKGGVQCNVAAVDISCMLFTILCNELFDTSKYSVFIFVFRLAIFSNFSLPKFINKPDSLLLEDQRD